MLLGALPPLCAPHSAPALLIFRETKRGPRGKEGYSPLTCVKSAPVHSPG